MPDPKVEFANKDCDDKEPHQGGWWKANGVNNWCGGVEEPGGKMSARKIHH
jgi:hypothetical protein